MANKKTVKKAAKKAAPKRKASKKVARKTATKKAAPKKKASKKVVKKRVTKKARPKTSKPKNLTEEVPQFGDTVDAWFDDVLGIHVDPKALKQWYDFSDSSQVIFGYPKSPGTYALRFPTQVGCGGNASINIFLFIHVANGVLAGISYSIINIAPDGEGTEMCMPMFEPDTAFVEDLLLSIAMDEDHAKIHSVITDRLRQMSLQELTTARDFFREDVKNQHHCKKYDKIMRER